MADNKSCGEKQLQKGINEVAEIAVSSGVDVSNALKGLKAIQREARKATQSLRELEEHQKKVNKRCPKCQGVNTEQTPQVKGCNDCGWHDA